MPRTRNARARVSAKPRKPAAVTLDPPSAPAEKLGPATLIQMIETSTQRSSEARVYVGPNHPVGETSRLISVSIHTPGDYVTAEPSVRVRVQYVWNSPSGGQGQEQEFHAFARDLDGIAAALTEAISESRREGVIPPAPILGHASIYPAERS